MTLGERRERRHAYYLSHREEILAKVTAYRLKNKARIAVVAKARRQKDPAKWKEYSRAQYRKHKAKRLAGCHAYHQANREHLLQKMRERYRKNAEVLKSRQRLYYRKHKNAARAYQKEYQIRSADKIRERSRKYRERRLEYLRAYDRMRAANPSPARRRAWKRWRRLNRERTNGYNQATRMKALMLLGRVCATCRWNEDVGLLEIDHRIPFFKRGLKRPSSGSAGALEALRNPQAFQLLCPNCHAIKTSIEKRQRNPIETKAKMKYERARDRLIIKFGSECRMCGFDEDPRAFEFDHIRPILGVNRSSAVHHVRKNPSLFQMLCANCHAMKTKLDRLELKRRKQEALGVQ